MHVFIGKILVYFWMKFVLQEQKITKIVIASELLNDLLYSVSAPLTDLVKNIRDETLMIIHPKHFYGKMCELNVNMFHFACANG